METLRCPSCLSPATESGQPSQRIFFSCGSYLYRGGDWLSDQTPLCSSEAENIELRQRIVELENLFKRMRITITVEQRVPFTEEVCRIEKRLDESTLDCGFLTLSTVVEPLKLLVECVVREKVSQRLRESPTLPSTEAPPVCSVH